MELDRAKFTGLRVIKGMSQLELAIAIGVSRPTIAGWEQGTISPKIAKLNKAAAELGVEPEELITKTSEVKS